MILLGASVGLESPAPASPGQPIGLVNRLEGKLYRPGGSQTDVLYAWALEQDAAGTWRSRYVAPDGTLAAEDELTWSRGEPAVYRYVRHTSREVSSVERVGDRLIFVRRQAGREDRAEETVAGLFAAGPSMVALVQAHWPELEAGHRLRVQYGVLDQLRTFAFDVFRVQDAPPSGRGAQAIVRMQLASFLQRLFLDPIDIVFSPAGDVLREIRGRALPVVWSNGSALPVDAELVIADPHPLPRSVPK